MAWGRPAAVWLTIVWLAFSVMSVPVGFAVEFHSIKFGKTQEVNGIADKLNVDRQVKELILLSTLGTLVGLIASIASVVYLTRPHVRAAFGERPANERRSRNGSEVQHLERIS